jgi:hypothetical protein
VWKKQPQAMKAAQIRRPPTERKNHVAIPPKIPILKDKAANDDITLSFWICETNEPDF